MTRCRPSSLTIPSPSEQQFLRWEDIEFLPNYDSRGLPVRITLRWIKGRRDIYDRRASKFKGVTFLITSCTEAANLPADPPWLLLVLGFERGLFAADTIEELLESPATLPMVPEVARGPVFLAGLANNQLSYEISRYSAPVSPLPCNKHAVRQVLGRMPVPTAGDESSSAISGELQACQKPKY